MRFPLFFQRGRSRPAASRPPAPPDVAPGLGVTVSGAFDYPSDLPAAALIVTITDPGHAPCERSGQYGPRLHLEFLDVDHPVPGTCRPEHLSQVLAFLRANPTGHVHVNCRAGISRSTATALLVLHERHPQLDAGALSAEVLRVRPEAEPNRVVLTHVEQITGLRFGGAHVRHDRPQHHRHADWQD
ncbi:hypothetical protein [Deinococcus soli (ex Cha et al. 2016)]|uniref:Uncharacterized protein n=2 Tax=Deinococcus soli (ex Cha et al. 2016) TaxID=1309411 RepID=A0ACC6KFG1_9DEIO|nr:hypothetical protein [Deinococcus soli (ex Cha et al. 2016)]MDR6218299.1 putative protein tyrosine phosphatase [Deinococcus soli (ex Cha et al. 2016)]MDR6329039.1 putative protein tyrosine phosphatase [Deinococcus soli (ex Cha et al. 2016)]MDR6751312.1 putative protein tyrosine phosphatase [Deinococcus soli (ex Cha et al. 2016)]